MPIIGIDLGTSNSAAAVLRGGRPIIAPSAEGITLGGKAFPSYAAITADGQMLVGEPARRQATVNPEGTTTAFKRLMGLREKVRLRDREFSPEELSGFLLQKIKRDAEAFLGEPIKQAVVTVPAYFNDNQRNATKDAARIAGLEVVRLVNEPTAASLAYGLDRIGQELRIAVVDFGGGTLDVTIMEFGKGVFEVKVTLGGVATPLIARNTPIPVKRSEIFTTAADMQTSVTVHVFQGERPMAPDNTSLGQFNLDGLPPAPRGVPKIKVTFDIDADGILNVTAKDMASQRSQSIRITGSTRLPEAEKQRMIEQAQQYAEQDKKRREEAEKLNIADSICYQGERTLADFGSKLSEDLRKRVEAAIRETREALNKRDAMLASQKADALKVVLQEAGQALYAQAPQPGPQPRPDVGAPTGEARPTGSGPGGRVVDAEYREASGGKQ